MTRRYCFKIKKDQNSEMNNRLAFLSLAAAAAASPYQHAANTPLLGGGPSPHRGDPNWLPSSSSSVRGPHPPPPGFSAADWVLFALVLVATAAAGVFHGCLRLTGGQSGSSAAKGLLEIRRRGVVTDLAFLFVCYSTYLVVIGKFYGPPCTVD